MIDCPVCGKYTFAKIDNYDICEICGWENEQYQRAHPDEGGGANKMSLNEYKAAWEAGKPCH